MPPTLCGLNVLRNVNRIGEHDMEIMLVYFTLTTAPTSNISHFVDAYISNAIVMSSYEECIADSYQYNTTHRAYTVGDTFTACMPIAPMETSAL